MSRIVVYGLEGVPGAVLVDALTGLPLQVAPWHFINQADGESFVRWMGAPCGDERHLQADARRWSGSVRSWLPCPTCPDGHHGRVRPGNAQCDGCAEETQRDNESPLNHFREPGRNGTRWNAR